MLINSDMRIAILTSGIMPVPAVQGGAVENLIDFYLDYNDRHRLHDITVYSVWHPGVKGHPRLDSSANHYVYIKADGPAAKIKKALFRCSHRDSYYHYTIGYYLRQAMSHTAWRHFDLIVVENRPGFVLQMQQAAGVPVILHLHNDFLNPGTREARAIFDGCSRIVSVSDFITHRVQSIVPDSGKCTTVYNAIDLEHFRTSMPKPREQVGMSADDFVLVYSGRLTKEKGILPLIQAVGMLHEIPRLKLLVVGASAYGKDRRPTPFMEQLFEACSLIREKVVFTGFVGYDEVASYLKMADVAVIPSAWEEPFGLTVVEAMAAGLPLVTTRSGGIPEICEGVAMIVDRGSLAENLASAILDLFRHPEKREAMSEASLLQSRRFDKDVYASGFFEALETLPQLRTSNKHQVG